jgi:hypothetical protein
LPDGGPSLDIAAASLAIPGASTPASPPALLSGSSQKPCTLHCKPLGQVPPGPHAGWS